MDLGPKILTISFESISQPLRTIKSAQHRKSERVNSAQTSFNATSILTKSSRKTSFSSGMK